MSKHFRPEFDPQKGLIIYNLFPRIVGNISNWYRYVDHAADMNFNTIYINPFFYPGFSGSLYAPKDYYEFNPLFLDRKNGAKQLEEFCVYAHSKDMRVIMDLIINHTSIDSVLVEQHPTWYKHNPDGSIKNPSAMDPADARNITVWGDLAEIDNEHSEDKENLWAYWRDLVLFYLSLGFDGFRCDAAYQVPPELWRLLITDAHGREGDVCFIAETLGCTEEDLVALSKAGFSYVYNSAKWWNFKDEWCFKQYNMSRKYCPSLSFPETHDTPRLFADVNGDIRQVKMWYQFSAFFSKGLMMPIGFEYGFKRKLDVVMTQPQDWETPRIDLTDFIRDVNFLKAGYKVLNQDSEIEILPHNNENIFMMLKLDADRQTRVLVIINLDPHNKHVVSLRNLRDIMKLSSAESLKDVSPEAALVQVGNEFMCELTPYQVKIIYGSLAKRWWD
ncbi:MAG: alpha-amylase [Candidatus Omnitrophica bacterium]|nr:alpha-amylase [Candidatus Omnitrophota bacterium]